MVTASQRISAATPSAIYDPGVWDVKESKPIRWNSKMARTRRVDPKALCIP